MTRIRFIGAYGVDVPEGAYTAAMDCHDDSEYVAKELGSLALVELEIFDMPATGSISEFKQPHTKYVPYDESYFDATTFEPLRHPLYKLPAAGNFRVAFYLHFYDPSEPLCTPFGSVQVAPVVGPPPSHLRGKSYEFWE
ncbi:MAG: hypothetical protein PSV40_06190 [Polaromonas sp.]|uniref:hypothetical protein n=1 Tax=Polaromonas sp. TaxID=1869339 RepID=UPI00248A70CC|nr:hypothetical protein [Polaromonas sp.]MDI1268678.1 hypothetical protein [Polaromonas sp.]